MLKHQELLKELTIEQKIEFISNINESGFLSEKSLKTPSAWKNHPSFSALPRSWDCALISKVSGGILAQYKKDGVKLVDLPDARAKTTPYDNGLSEDPYLSGKLVGAIATAGKRHGIETCMSDPLMTAESIYFSDIEYNERAVKEYFSVPYRILKKQGVKTVKTNAKVKQGAYEKANLDIALKLQESCNVIYENVSSEEYIKSLFVDGKLIFKGSKTAILDAYSRYSFLMKSFEDGEIALSDVTKACENGTAVSPDMIDAVADKYLDIVDEFSSLEEGGNDNFNAKVKDLELYSAIQSTVLLKKDKKALPIARKKKVAVIGQLAQKLSNEFANRLAKKKYAGYSEGYDLGQVKDKELITKACDLAKTSDVVVVGIGYNDADAITARKNRTTKLPAGQEELLSKLYELKVPVIAVLYGNCSFDMSFDKYCSAIILASGNKEKCLQATYAVIYGKENPGGRLTNTLYYDTEERFENLRRYKNAKRNRVGTYYGYRHYVSSEHDIKYPFGFGLSYTKFSYSKLKITENNIEFTVRNSGKRAGTEIVQIYVGAKDSAIIRPKKELKAFIKVELKKGRKKRISVPISDMDLRIYDPNVKKYVKELATYNVYIGASATDEKLKGTFSFGSVAVKPDNLKESSFLQAKGNICDGKYYLEEPMTLPKFAKQSRMRFAFSSLFIVGFFEVIYFYLSSTGWLPVAWWIYLGLGVLLGAPLISAITLKIAKNNVFKKLKEKSKIMKMEKRSKIDIDELNDEIPYEQLFLEEFEQPVIDVNDEEENEIEVKDEGFINEVYDPSFTIDKACAEAITYLKERGLYTDIHSMRALFSSLASSRLIILNSENKEFLSQFVKLLGEYFACTTAVDEFSYIHAYGDDIISSVDAGLTETANAILNIHDKEGSIRLVALANAESEFIKPCFAKVFKYIDQPSADLSISVKTDAGEQSINMPENVWFIVTLADGQKATDIPKYILESSSVVDVLLREIEGQKAPAIEKVFEEVAIEEVLLEETAIEQPEEAPLADEVVVPEKAEEVVLSDDLVIPETVEELSVPEQEEVVDDKTYITTVSYYQFVKMMEVAKRDYMLDEALWKRIDKLEIAVNEMDSTYHISNKLWQRIEKYVALYLNAGGDPEEALDSVVAHHLINSMITSVVKAPNKNERFAHIVENIFGEGHVPTSLRAIKLTGLKI